MKILNFPWDFYLDDEHKEVWVHIPGGYPSTLALPLMIEKFFPDYKGHLCSESFLQSLKNNEQKESN